MAPDNQPAMAGTPLLSVEDVSKSFTIHLRGGIRLPVVANVTFDVSASE